jgi:cAMP-dependent protein kinase regulator
VDSGQLDCYKKFKPNENETFLKTYQPGESFGELALLYNAPRAATIIAKTESILFALDRECFNNIVKDSAIKRREKYETFLGKVDLLSSMDPYEKGQLADVLKTLKFKKGDFVIRQVKNICLDFNVMNFEGRTW